MTAFTSAFYAGGFYTAGLSKVIISGDWNELKTAASNNWDEALSTPSGNWTTGQGITVTSGDWNEARN